MKSIILDSEARAELIEAEAWYDDRQFGVGLELHEEVDAALLRIQNDPGVGARYRNTDYRFFRVRRFPYLLYYLDLPDSIWIAAVAHERRRPNYWRKRKP